MIKLKESDVANIKRRVERNNPALKLKRTVAGIKKDVNKASTIAEVNLNTFKRILNSAIFNLNNLEDNTGDGVLLEMLKRKLTIISKMRDECNVLNNNIFDLYLRIDNEPDEDELMELIMELGEEVANFNMFDTEAVKVMEEVFELGIGE